MEAPPPLIPDQGRPESPAAPFSAPPHLVERRNPTGWVLLAVLGGFLFVAQMVSYFMGNPKGQTSDADVTAIKAQLKSGAMMKWLEKEAGVKNPSKKAVKGPGLDPSRSLMETRRKLERSASKNESNAFLASLIAFEHGDPPAKAAADNLADSDIPAYRAYAEAIAKPELTLGEAKATVAKIDGARFTRELARSQILYKAGDKKAHENLFPAESFVPMLLAILVGMGALAIGVLALALGIYNHQKGSWETKGLPQGGLTFAGADRYAGRMGWYLVIHVGSSLVVGANANFINGLVPGLPMLAQLLLVFLAVLLLLWVPMDGVSDGLGRIVGDKKDIGRHVMVGVGAFFANVPVILVLALIVTAVTAPFRDLFPTPSHPINQFTSDANPFTMAILLVTAAVLAPLIEELTFRGLLTPALAKITKPLTAIVLQGFFFASIHPQGPLAWPMLMAIGCMAGVVSYKQGSLIPSMVMHGLHNGAILIVALTVL